MNECAQKKRARASHASWDWRMGFVSFFGAKKKTRSEMWGVQRKGNLPQARLTQVLTAAKTVPCGSSGSNFKSWIGEWMKQIRWSGNCPEELSVIIRRIESWYVPPQRDTGRYALKTHRFKTIESRWDCQSKRHDGSNGMIKVLPLIQIHIYKREARHFWHCRRMGKKIKLEISVWNFCWLLT